METIKALSWWFLKLCQIYFARCSSSSYERLKFPLTDYCPIYNEMWGNTLYTLKKGDFCSGTASVNKTPTVGYKQLLFPTCDERIFPVIVFMGVRMGVPHKDDLYDTCWVILANGPNNPDNKLCIDKVIRTKESVQGQSNERTVDWLVYLTHGLMETDSWKWKWLEVDYLWHNQEYKDNIEKSLRWTYDRYRTSDRRVVVGFISWRIGAAGFKLGFNQSLIDRMRTFFENFIVAPYNACNILLNRLLGGFYPKAASNAMAVGRMVGKFTSYIKRQAQSMNTFCIGASLGAHLCGFIGKEHKLTGIIANDPAGPIFKRNSKGNRLNKNDAHAVHVFHSNTLYLGIKEPIGHVDFYINGGEKQEEACKDDWHEFFWKEVGIRFCSHGYAVKVVWYAISIRETDKRFCATNIYCPLQNATDIDCVDFSWWNKERSSSAKPRCKIQCRKAFELPGSHDPKFDIANLERLLDTPYFSAKRKFNVWWLGTIESSSSNAKCVGKYPENSTAETSTSTKTSTETSTAGMIPLPTSQRRNERPSYSKQSCAFPTLHIFFFIVLTPRLL